MAVPENIRKVDRPKNTIVKLVGNKYAVIQRVGCKRINGKNVPINGSVIGHIVNNKYVAKEIIKVEITLKNYGDYRLAYNLSSNLLAELKECYDFNKANHIYAIALLRSIYNELKDYQIKDAYEESFLSNEFANLNLSKNNVSKIIKEIGKDYSNVIKFMQLRVDHINNNNHIAIDGMLKSNNSKINSLNDFSYKSRIKSTKDISLIIAFDITSKEILCSLPYSGNCVDSRSFPDFIKKTGIKNGVVIMDKEMTNEEELKDIGYIFLLKRSLKILNDELDIYTMNEKLNIDRAILCKKVKYNNKYYYGYKDILRAGKEEADFISGKKFTIEELEKKKKRFGTIVYVSNQDLTLDEAYNLYKERWEIELVNKFYKDFLELETVREHDDYSVLGSEFINFLSSIIGNRIKNKFIELGLLKKYTYKQLIKILCKYKKIKDPKNESLWFLSKLTKSEEEILKKLGI